MIIRNTHRYRNLRVRQYGKFAVNVYLSSWPFGEPCNNDVVNRKSSVKPTGSSSLIIR
jgi:hypothetical protein